MFLLSVFVFFGLVGLGENVFSLVKGRLEEVCFLFRSVGEWGVGGKWGAGV